MGDYLCPWLVWNCTAHLNLLKFFIILLRSLHNVVWTKLFGQIWGNSHYKNCCGCRSILHLGERSIDRNSIDRNSIDRNSIDQNSIDQNSNDQNSINRRLNYFWSLFNRELIVLFVDTKFWSIVYLGSIDWIILVHFFTNRISISWPCLLSLTSNESFIKGERHSSAVLY